MPQLPTLPNPPTKPVPRLENRNLDATPQQDIRTPQPGEPSAHNTHADHLLRSSHHSALEHVLGMHDLVCETLPRVQVLQNARGAGGRAVGVVLACLHGSKLRTGSAGAAGGFLLLEIDYARFTLYAVLSTLLNVTRIARVKAFDGIASKHFSTHRDVDARQLTVATNYFTSKRKPFRQKQLAGNPHGKSYSPQRAETRNTLSIYHNRLSWP